MWQSGLLPILDAFTINVASVMVGSISDDPTLKLDGANDIAMFECDTVTYDIVSSPTGNGIQMPNLANPVHPTAAGFFR